LNAEQLSLESEGRKRGPPPQVSKITEEQIIKMIDDKI